MLLIYIPFSLLIIYILYFIIRSTTNFNQGIMAPGGVRPPPTSHATSQLSRTGGRGDALNAKLNDYIRKKSEKPTITIEPGQKIPTGDWATEFQTEIGIIVRKFAPWSTRSKWKSIGKSDLKKFYDLILYRQFRCTLHKHYLQYKQNGTKRENPHHQTSSTQGKKSQEANTTIHCTGSKPFARYREEMYDPETSEVVEQIEFYKLTHCKNDIWTCHTAEENYGKMLELRAEPTPEGSTPLTDAQICKEVLGVRSGYVKGLGHGYEKPSSSSLEYNAEVDEQNHTIQGLVTDTTDIRRILLEMQGNRQSIPENRQSTPENHQRTS
ncbi:hypothetical protein MKX03_028050 [Papaver bracteatum]|nr:hypothetical protein MKX03_028050 [Papaver bracteatum]